MNRTIKVTKRFENQTKSNPPKTWWSVYAGSEKYSTWDAKVAATLQEGAEATVDFYTKDGYHTITSIVSQNTSVPQEAITKALDSVYPENNSPVPMPAQPRREIPEVASLVHERIKAYEIAARIVSSMNAEYKDINRIADSALAYFHGTSDVQTRQEAELNLDEFLRKE